MRYHKSKYTLDENFFEVIDTEEKAYFLGLLFADGCNQTTGISKFVTLELQERDKPILEAFKTALGSNTKLMFSKGVKENHSNMYRLQINSKKISNDLVNHGCISRKSLVLKFPTSVPDELIHHFIRGYFDGDGCIWKGKRYTSTVKDAQSKTGYRDRIIQNVKFTLVGTRSFLTSAQDILIDKLGFKRNVLNTRKITTVCALEYSGRIQAKKFENFLYKDATVYLKRKKEKFKDVQTLC